METPFFDAEQSALQEKIAEELRDSTEYGKETISLEGEYFISLANAFGVEVPDGARQLLDNTPCILIEAREFAGITREQLGEKAKVYINYFDKISNAKGKEV